MRHDLLRAWRNFLHHPRFVIVAAGSMGLGIAAASAIFAFANAILLRPLPLPGSEQLVSLQESVRGEDAGGSPKRLTDWLQAPSLAGIAGYYGENFTLETGQFPERVAALRTFGDLPGTFRLPIALGRAFTSEEQKGAAVAIVTDSFWRSRFGADRTALGRKLRLSGKPYEVIGVLAPGVRLEEAEIVVPETNQDLPRAARFLAQTARLRDGVSLRQAQTELNAVAARLAVQYPDTDANMTVRVTRLRDELGRDARLPLLVLLGAVCFLVVMASINVASLSLSRLAGRGAELAVRQALGASRVQLVRMMFVENALVALAGGVLGWTGAVWGLDLLRAVAPADLPRLGEVRIDGAVAAFAIAVTFFCALVSGLFPAVQGAGADLQSRLKDGTRGSGSRHRARQVLVAAQVALSLAMVAGGVLLFRTVWSLDNRPLGFTREKLLTFRLSYGWDTDSAKLHATYKRVLEQLGSTPGVNRSALTDRLPLGGGTQSGEVKVEGKARGVIPEGATLGIRAVSHGYHELMGVPLLRGRLLESGDGGKRRAVINEAAARAYFPGENPIGRLIGIEWRANNAKAPMYEIVGVAGNLPDDPRELRPMPAAYIPYDASYWPMAHFVVSTSADPVSMTDTVRKAVAAAGASAPVENVRTMDTFISSRNRLERLAAWTVGVFAAAALLLASIGIFGMVAGSVAERRIEIGIRMALGADPARLMRDTLGRALRQIAIGLAAGLGLAAALARAISSTLFGVKPEDVTTYLLAAAVLFGVALAAAWWPARQAARLSPSIALRRD